MQGTWVRSLVRELDPMFQSRVHMLQLKCCSSVIQNTLQFIFLFFLYPPLWSQPQCFSGTWKNCSYLRRSRNTMEKAVAPHSSTLAWKIPWTEEPGGLQSMGSLWVGHDWATSLSLFTFMHWRRKWQPTPVFLPGESQGQGSLVGCRLWGRTESDTTEVT